MRGAGGARDRHHVLSPRQHPGERELRRRHAHFARERVEGSDRAEIVPELWLDEARHGAADVAFVVAVVVHGTRQQPARDRRVCDEGDAPRAAGVEQSRLRIAHHRRVFVLHRRDRVNRMSPRKGGGRHLAEPDRADLARLLGPDQRADRLLDRHVAVEPMQVVEVDAVGAEPAERRVQRLRDRLRPAVEHAPAIAHVEHALAGEGELGPAVHHRAPEQLLVATAAVKRRRVEQGHAAIQRVVEQPGALVLWRRHAVGVAQIHAAEPDRRHRERPDSTGQQCGHSGSPT